ncbi:MAG: hypothetical protein ABR552_09770 [Actinomycetota bacterium]|nr:hypothetical protein [Actinomycetota bacterium]
MVKRRGVGFGAIVGAACMAAALFGYTVVAHAGGGTPADKVTAAGKKTMVEAPNAATPILTATMSTSKPTDLILSVTLECSILTTVTNTGTSTASAFGQVRVWVEVDGQIVPVQSISSPPQNTPPPGNDSDKAVFCERTHTVNFMPSTETETIQQFQSTKNADAFTWLRQNVGAGSHTIVVKADLNTTATNGTAEAIIGNRTLVVDPVKMANNAIIA